MTITAERAATVTCPAWCDDDHIVPAGDGREAHCGQVAGVNLSAYADGSGHDFTVLTSIQQLAEDAHPHVVVTHHDGATEDKLTAAEATRLATILRDHAEIIRACGDHLCWCDGLHRPGDEHMGEFQNVGLELHERPADQITTWIWREWKGKKSYVRLTWSDERHEANMTPDEADQLAAMLQAHAAIVGQTAG